MCSVYADCAFIISVIDYCSYRISDVQMVSYIVPVAGATVISSNTTIGGTGVVSSFSNLIVTNSATLTVASGTLMNANNIIVNSGASITLQGVTLIVNATLQNLGTVTSSDATDSIWIYDLRNVGTMSVAGTVSLRAGDTQELTGTIEGAGTLTLDGNAIVTSSVTLSIATVNGIGTLEIGVEQTLTISTNSAFSIPTVNGAGTLVIDSGDTLTFSGSNLLPTTLTANGTLALSGNYTLVTNITNPTTAAGDVQVNSGFTLTITSSVTLGFVTVEGAGTLSVSSGDTLTIGANSTFSISTVTGTGILSVSATFTLTLSASYTFTFSTVSGAGTLSVSATFTLTASGTISITTIIVDGIMYYTGSSITAAISNAQATFAPTLSGTGIFIGAPAGKGTATAAIALSATKIASDDGDGSAKGTGLISYYNLTSITGSLVGRYTIGFEDTTSVLYLGYVLIYVGSTSAYTVSGNFGSTKVDDIGDAIEAYNMTGSAGTITLSGDCYV